VRNKNLSAIFGKINIKGVIEKSQERKSRALYEKKTYIF
jgi:hypothetical protein